VWRIVTATFLATGLAIGGVRAGESGSTPALDSSPDLASPYQPYNLKLAYFYPIPNHAGGVIVYVRINGGRRLRMVLDSGAEFMVIGARVARSAGLATGPEIGLVGLGSRSARVGRAEIVETGPVSFRNCRVLVVDGNVVEGADGVIPLSLFSAFQLRLNLPEKTLGMVPYAGEQNPGIPPAREVTKHNLLLFSTVLNGRQSGYVLLDTGAYCSAISREAARALSGFPIVPEVLVAAGTGAAIGQIVSSPVHFAIADQDLIPNEIVALDLSNLSRHYGVEVIGVLGFPALSNYVLTIDYPNARVKIEPPQRNSARELLRGYNAKTPAALSFH
jgi:hypothetical protein